ncbi:calcium-dependent phosphotriesterase [Neoconidiobolus thromboides FSU 785]|nr:calcium-dependent phosphotriesterase [Neoconidiobolus thromboides FSU 785]
MSILLNLSLAIIAILGYYFYPFITLLFFTESFLTTFEQSDLSNCKSIPELKGCEDLAINYDSKFAIFGCPEDYTTNKYWVSKHYNPKTGIPFGKMSHFYAYDYTQQKAKKLNMIGFPKNINFAIHGFDIIKDDKDSQLNHIYAINHLLGGLDHIEHFTYKIGSDEVVHKESITDETFINLNSIVLVTSTSFYISKESENISGVSQYLESHGIIGNGKVLYRDTKGELSTVASKIISANGLALNYAKDELYLAENKGGRVWMFTRDIETGELEVKDKIELSFLPDNIKVDPSSGRIYIAGFPKTHKVFDYFENFGKDNLAPIPAIAVRISNETGDGRFYGKNFKVETLLMDEQGPMSSLTVIGGIESENRVLLSGLLGPNGMLDCPVDLT